MNGPQPGQDVPEQLAIKAATRAVEGLQAQVYVSGGITRIEFTEESFTAWYAEECAQIRKDERAKVADAIERAFGPFHGDDTDPYAPDVVRWLRGQCIRCGRGLDESCGVLHMFRAGGTS